MSSSLLSWRRAKRGFTLIELLVVIAIIAILAAILFPVFARARENARRSSCQSNLKQIGLGIMQYVQDYDETMPGHNMNGNGGNQAQYWMDIVQPYVKSDQLFVCPSDPGGRYFSNRPHVGTRPNGNGGTVNWDDGGYDGSYGANVASWEEGDASTPSFSIYDRHKATSLSRIESPASTFMVGDATGFEVQWQNSGNKPGITGTAGNRNLSNLRERHLETTNVLYCDGHVKALKLDALAVTGTTNAYKAFSIELDPD